MEVIVNVIKEKVDEETLDFLLLDPTDNELWANLDDSLFDREVLDHLGLSFLLIFTLQFIDF
jgi:hypothetical protein